MVNKSKIRISGARGPQTSEFALYRNGYRSRELRGVGGGHVEALVPKMDHSHRMGGTRDPFADYGTRIRSCRGVSTGDRPSKPGSVRGDRRGARRGDAASLMRRTPGMVPRSRCASANLLALATASVPNQPATPDRRHAAPAMPALMCDRGVEKRGMHLPACIRHRRWVPPTILSHHGETRGTTTRGASMGWRILYLVSCIL